MGTVTVVTWAALLPPLLADLPPSDYYRHLLRIVPQEYAIPPLADADRDGLPDREEARLGTDPGVSDTDGDGLPDYEEVRKHRTDPLAQDSDSDGVQDGDWEERREYAYTIRAVVDLRPPFRLAQMNDLYQDARILDSLADDVSRVEVVLYPEARELLNPSAYAPVESAFTSPTYAKNWDAGMRDDLWRRIGRPATDLRAAFLAMSDLVVRFHRVDAERDLGYVDALPMQFEVYRDPCGIVHRSYSGQFLALDAEEVEQRVFFARGMYRNRTHQDCSSIATLAGAMLRAVGLEEQTVYSIPLFYTLDSDGTEISMSRDYPRKLIGQESSRAVLADHFYNQVRIGARWVRVDQARIDAGVNGPNIKLLACHDQADDPYTYWDCETWTEKRVYVFRQIGDQEPVHRGNRA